MGEKLRKPIGYITIAALAGLALYADRASGTSDATEAATSTSTSIHNVYSDPDPLIVCRIPAGSIDEECAAEQVVNAIDHNDGWKAGMWALNVHRPDLAYEIDQREFTAAQQADLAQKVSDCELWSQRVDAPDLYALLPECG